MSKVGGKFLGDITHKEVPSGSINSSNTTFTLTYAPTSADSLNLYMDGLLLRLTTDYTISSTTITMGTAPATGQTLYASYQYKA